MATKQAQNRDHEARGQVKLKEVKGRFWVFEAVSLTQLSVTRLRVTQLRVTSLRLNVVIRD